MQQSSSYFKGFVKRLQVLYTAMMVMVTIVLLFSKYLMELKFAGLNSFSTYFFVGIVTISLLLYFTLYRKMIDAIKADKGPATEEKLNRYKEAFAFKMALLVSPALAGAVLHFIDDNPLLFYSSLAFIVLLVLQRPTEEKIVEELGIKF